MSTSPRISQALLAALCPAGDFREAVLGDLAEEHAARIEMQGAAAAGRWYRREALRAAPHAVSAWARGLRFADGVRLIAIAASTVVVARVFQYSLLWIVVASWGTIAVGLLLAVPLLMLGIVLLSGATGARFDHWLLITAPSGWLGYTTLGGVLRVWHDARGKELTS